MDELRARAFLDMLLGMDSRPTEAATSDGASAAGEPAGPVPGEAAGPEDAAGPGLPGTPPAGAVPPGFVGRLNLTIPLTTMLGLADRPGEAAGIGPVDPELARDLARAAARNPKTTWCLTVTDRHGHAIGHGCGRPAPGHYRAEQSEPAIRAGPDPPGGYGTWRLATGIPGQRDLIVTVEPITTDPCDHRHEARGHDPGTLLRHLTQIRYASCTGPACRRPATQAEFEHNIPYEAGGRTCMCNGHPKCRRDHRVKQHPRWKVDQLASGNVRWTTPAGRQYTTEPTRYPI
jgi:hypothetical protein